MQSYLLLPAVSPHEKVSANILVPAASVGTKYSVVSAPVCDPVLSLGTRPDMAFCQYTYRTVVFSLHIRWFPGKYSQTDLLCLQSTGEDG